ncbi:uncharacterized protein BX664DRAFT_362158 [Halteromyces radiatus]|uniref:uncharacterized protein n=1 Tax=Halteromyces radiatus TaxID=101107 RepID=UPI00221E6D26|nr:uncharacterized protein BX664DRAFT_362158 [Halteromyces radiatus]KAI8080040.1 hypothetical protein BX664DRAFT_362158 [Halteromyces radiatus]
MNNQITALNEHAPAQMVGGMRVKQANHRRTSLSEAKKAASAEEDIESSEEDQQQMEEMEKRKQEQIRQENAMRSHQASRDMNISRNAGSHVKARIDPSFQPRDLNH